MPTPGSPESRTTAPATIPPPSTRSNSAMPVGRCSAVPAEISVMGRAARVAVGARGAGIRPPPASASTTVFHCWHSPQRPTHFALVQPHSAHRKVAVGRAMTSA